MENICIGIDLGTTFSAVGYWNGDHCEIIQNKDGKNITPSWVSFTDNEILVVTYSFTPSKNILPRFAGLKTGPFNIVPLAPLLDKSFQTVEPFT
jgi:hypothetical protein